MVWVSPIPTYRIDQRYRSIDSPPSIWFDRFRISRPTESDMRNDSFSTMDPTMTHLDAIAVDTEVSDQLETATRMSKAPNPVIAILNRLLGATWSAYAQHQT